jgi:hypothetical protein
MKRLNGYRSYLRRWLSFGDEEVSLMDDSKGYWNDGNTGGCTVSKDGMRMKSV